MQTQGLTTGLKGKARDAQATKAIGMAAGTSSRLAVSALVVGAAIGAWSAWGMERIAATVSEPPADVAPIVAAPPAAAAGRVTAAGRSLVLSIPSEDAYLTSRSIPVAGTAYGRAHGPAVSAVHVELSASGRSITSADIPVFSGRYAGVLEVPTLDGGTKAELRISDPLHKGAKAIVRNVTLDQR
jgi:hypothetical protein